MKEIQTKRLYAVSVDDDAIVFAVEQNARNSYARSLDAFPHSAIRLFAFEVPYFISPQDARARVCELAVSGGGITLLSTQ